MAITGRVRVIGAKPKNFLPGNHHIDRGLISRLDHAAYLGRELARAEESLRSGEPFVQDAAPEKPLVLSTSPCTCAACH
jgi:tetrahydromethanopterin S-methyltransferase subunit A